MTDEQQHYFDAEGVRRAVDLTAHVVRRAGGTDFSVFWTHLGSAEPMGCIGDAIGPPAPDVPCVWTARAVFAGVDGETVDVDGVSPDVLAVEHRTAVLLACGSLMKQLGLKVAVAIVPDPPSSDGGGGP